MWKNIATSKSQSRANQEGEFSRKSPNFATLLALFAPLKGFPLESGSGVPGQKLNDGDTAPRKKFDDIFGHLQCTNVTDGQTDTGLQQRPRLRLASRGKNCEFVRLKMLKRSRRLKSFYLSLLFVI